MKTNITKLLSLALLCLLLAPVYHLSAQTRWTAMGPTEGNQPSTATCNSSDFVLDPSGTPYIVFTDANGAGISVRKYINNTWSYVGTPDFVQGMMNSCAMVIDATGMPYVMFPDPNHGGRPTVMTYDGASWIPVGASSIYQARCSDANLAIDHSGNLYIAFQDTTPALRVMKYDGTSWTYIGANPIVNSHSTNILLTLDPSGTPYIVFNPNAAGAVVMKYDGVSWSQLGSFPALMNSLQVAAFAISPSGTPYIMYGDETSGGILHAQSYNGAAWIDVGIQNQIPVQGRMSPKGLLFDGAGVLYGLVETLASNSGSKIIKYDGTSWTSMGSSDIGYYVVRSRLALDATGTPYVGWSGGANINATVKKLTASNWEYLGSEGIAGLNSYMTSLVSDHNGVIYMSCTNDSAVSVKKYENYNWSDLADPNITFAEPTLMDIDSDDVLTLAYRDTTLMTRFIRYNAGTWTDMGSPISVPPYLRTLKTRNATPYLSYVDYTASREARIIYYDGSMWHSVDTVGFTPHYVTSLSMDVDRHDSLYVAYTDTLSHSVHVLKYAGGIWTSLGIPGSAGTETIQIAVDLRNDIPYVLYQDSAQGNKLSMYKYDGGNWTSFGNPGFATIEHLRDARFIINEVGEPLVSYPDINYRMNVVKVVNNVWTNVGQPDYNLRSPQLGDHFITASPSGIIYSVFNTSGMWGYQYNSVPDSIVWPGDADANHIADNADLLPIGLAYGTSGPARAAQSIVWQGYQSTDWTDSFTLYAPGVNYKHADCNGDGIINANDTTAIIQNFNLVHNKTDGSGSPWRSGIPALSLRFSRDTVADGDTLITTVLIGDSVTSATNLYGLAFTYHYDPLVVDSTSLSFRFVPSFLSNGTSDISIHKDFATDGIVKAAVTGINHLNRTGYGPIARFFCIITTDNLNGKDLSYYSNANFISDITAIDKDGNAIALNAGTDSNQVAFEPTGIRDISAEHVSVHPNPASSQVTVTAQSAILQITITDMLGQQSLAPAGHGAQSQSIDVSSLAPGVYSVHISTQTGSGTGRLVITR